MKNKILRLWAAWSAWAAATAMALLVLCGCQTTVPVTYTEPARLNMSGANRIAVDSDNPQVATSVSQKLTATRKYAVATAAELSDWKRWGEERQAMEQLARHQAQATEVSAADLAGAYSANTVRADSSYSRKILRITGVVNEINSARGRYYVRLAGAGNDSVFIYFAPSETSKMAAVDRGQTITIIGECFGRNTPDDDDIAEILRILGAGSRVNVANSTFPVDELKDYPGPVDAVIFLNTASSVQDSTSTVKEAAKDADGKTITDAEGKTVYRDVTVYERSVTVNIAYRIIRTRDSSSIGQGTKSATSAKSSNKDRSKLPSEAELVAKTIDKPLAEFISEIVPTQRSISVTLAKESENKEAKKEMSAAEKLVKEKNYPAAVAAYAKIYAQYKNFAAGYNQAVLTETTAGTAAAIVLMEALAKETGNSLARTTLTEMQRRNASNQQAAAQLSQ